jgi:hypothetical protein
VYFCRKINKKETILIIASYFSLTANVYVQ